MNSDRFMRIWKMPLIISILSVFGLFAALLGTGSWHWLAWISLSVPIIILIRFIMNI